MKHPVEVTYKCGHRVKFDSPYPAVINAVLGSDDVIHISELGEMCLICRGTNHILGRSNL